MEVFNSMKSAEIECYPRPRMRHGASQQCLLPKKEFAYLTGVPHVTWLACSVMNLCHACILENKRGTAMARRKGGLTELLEIASALPWKCVFH